MEDMGSSMFGKRCKTTRVNHTMPFNVSELHNLLMMSRGLEDLEAEVKSMSPTERRAFRNATEIAEQYSPTMPVLRAVL